MWLVWSQIQTGHTWEGVLLRQDNPQGSMLIGKFFYFFIKGGQILAGVKQSNATSDTCHTLLVHTASDRATHTETERGAVSLARMISPVRFSHLRIEGRFRRHREIKWLYYLNCFIDKIFGEARLHVTARALKNKSLNWLIESKRILVNKCRGQGYNGASAVSGVQPVV
jgi:hypothetical protein